MKSSGVGAGTSAVEVLNISTQGIWLYVTGVEYFLPYAEFPWFQDVCLTAIHRVRLLHGHHLRWDDLDVDLDLDALEHLEHYPLKYRS